MAHYAERFFAFAVIDDAYVAVHVYGGEAEAPCKRERMVERTAHFAAERRVGLGGALNARYPHGFLERVYQLVLMVKYPPVNDFVHLFYLRNNFSVNLVERTEAPADNFLRFDYREKRALVF